MRSEPLEVAVPGRVEYGRAVAWQEALVARRLAGGGDALLLLEHPPVYTLRPDVRWYLRQLEAMLIAALAGLGIAAERIPEATGVWVGGRKIGSIGVALRRWVTWHGFALNVGEDLRGFTDITPCGITGVEMTSVSREGGPADVEVVGRAVLAQFVKTFGYPGWAPLNERPPDEVGTSR